MDWLVWVRSFNASEGVVVWEVYLLSSRKRSTCTRGPESMNVVNLGGNRHWRLIGSTAVGV